MAGLVRSLRNVFLAAAAAAVVSPPSSGDYYGVTANMAWVPAAYSAASDIPSDAIDYLGGGYSSLATACAAAVIAGKALKINCDINSSTLSMKMPPGGIYGYPGTGSGVGGRPKITYTGSAILNETPALLYAWNADLKARWLHFEDFGDVFNVAPGSKDRDSDGTFFDDITDSNTYGFRRAVPTSQGVGGNGGVGVQLDTTVYPIDTIGAAGPAIDVRECVFKNCQHAVYYLSDSLRHGASYFLRNVLDGTFGGVDMHCTINGDFYAAYNIWTGLTRADGRPIPSKAGSSNLNGHRFHTMFKIGIENPIDIAVGTQILFIDANTVEGVQDELYQDTLNTAVFADVRNGNPTWVTGAGNAELYNCSIRMTRNKIIGLKGLWGQEDAQPFYTKLLGYLIAENWMEDCGSSYSAVTSNGTVATGSNVITGLSGVDTNNVRAGATITGAGIPTTARVGVITGNTMTMVNTSGAAVTATADSTLPIVFLNGDGSETCGILSKEPGPNWGLATSGAAWCSRANVLKSMPRVTDSLGNRMLIKAANPQLPWYVINNLIVDCEYSAPGGSGGFIRVTDDENTSGAWVRIVRGNKFWRCPHTPGRIFISHEPKSASFATTVVENNIAYWASGIVDWSAHQQGILFNAGTPTAVTRSGNKYVGSAGTYIMQVQTSETGAAGSIEAVPAEPTLAG